MRRYLRASANGEYTIETADESQIRELENGSAFTWEGMSIDESNLKDIVDFFKDETPQLILPIHFYTWSGAEMNRIYGLTGNNAYPDDLNFLSISLDNWSELGNLWMIKMQLGARWLDDIVDNNARRERENH